MDSVIQTGLGGDPSILGLLICGVCCVALTRRYLASLATAQDGSARAVALPPVTPVTTPHGMKTVTPLAAQPRVLALASRPSDSPAETSLPPGATPARATHAA